MNKPNDNLTKEINFEIVDHVYRQFHQVLIADSLGAIVFTTILWNVIDHRLLLMWLAPELIINGICRHILTFLFFSLKKRGQIKNFSTWHYLYIGSIFISGVFWALGGCLFVFTPNPIYRIVILMYLIGIIGAGIPPCIPSKPSNLVFVILVTLSMIVISLSFSGYFSIGLVLAVLIYVFSSLNSAFMASDTMIKSFKLQYTNLRLSEDLSSANNTLNESETALRLIQENAPIGMAIVSLSGEWLNVNKALCEIIGYNKTELKGRTFQEITFQDDLEMDLDYVRQLIQGQISSYQIEKRYIQKNGRIVWVLLTVSLARDKNNKPMYFISQIQNIDERKRNEKYANETKKMNWMLQICHSSSEAYSIANQFAQEIFDEYSGGLAIYDNAFNNLNTVFNWGEAQLLKKTFDKENCWALRGADVYISNQSSNHLICDHFATAPSGEYICIPLIAEGELIGVMTFTAAKGQIISDYNIQNMISFGNALKLSLVNIRLQEMLQSHAIHDALTGLFNRRYLTETLQRELLRISRENKMLCIGMLDLDFFKRINDAYGHDAGDTVLKHIGALLNRNFRGNDICCRYGGEEFVIVMADTNLKDAVQKLEFIRQEVENAHIFFQDSALPKITISIGVAEAPTHASTAETIIQMADDALYAAKRTGRNKVMIANC